MDKHSTIPFEVRSPSIAGMGAFAINLIRAGDVVIEYIGEGISKEESLRRCIDGNNYIFQINDEFDIDGSIEANLARFINHSCAPNAEAQLDGEHVWIIALRDIAPGEEITFNYGYDLDDYREHPCNCGAPNCFGYILAEEFWSVATKPDAQLSHPPSQPEQEQFAASPSD
ncbi:MAG TPA: SET domain-containing protein-lysine N-methyltransferase [Candidatus Binatia bacterium]|nr:SET domain-containing protein-lysine N-methyltransferase [Candidatus Binatia bacterium]